MSNEAPEKPPCNTPEHDSASTVVDGDGVNDNNDTSNSALAKGLSTIISSIIREFDGSAAATSRSQDQLSSTLDRLTGELDKLLEDAPLPFIMQHAARISGVRKRITSLNSLLKSIQRRLDSIDHTLSAGLIHGTLIFFLIHLMSSFSWKFN
uniref:Biogenesis of lysosome-related organelles complex 1 subunit 7 n=1 Tax=Solanum tuberosum TaxID=4113 RepID=M1C019_SOLTU